MKEIVYSVNHYLPSLYKKALDEMDFSEMEYEDEPEEKKHIAT